MKQTIEIEIPEGKKAVWKDNKVVFEDIEPQLPKTWREFCNDNPIKLSEFYVSSTGEITNFKAYNFESINKRPWGETNFLPSKQDAEAHLALMQLHQLRDCYRQGWVPNYLDESRKWYITKYYNRPVVSTTYNFSAFLSFQSKEIAQEFLGNFKDLIEQAGDLI